MGTSWKRVGIAVGITLVAIAIWFTSKTPPVPSSSHGNLNSAPQGSSSKEEDLKGAIERKGSVLAKAEITPSTAAAALEALKKNPNVQKRAEEAFVVIMDLCKAGYEESAWELIEANSGLVRKWELTAFFQYAKLEPGGLVEKLQELPYKNEALEFLGVKLETLSVADLKILIKKEDLVSFFEGKKGEDPKFLEKLLQKDLMVRSSSSKPASKIEAIQQAIDWNKQGLIDPNTLIKIVANDPNPDPWQRWSLISAHIPSTEPNSFPGVVRGGAIDKMVESDAKKTLDAISKTEGTQGAWDFSRGLRKWTSVDAAAANSWYEANKGNLGEAQRDAAAETFSLLALEYGESENAVQWANQIESTDKRNKALEKLRQQNK
jgi:hypothetical protein